MQVDNNVDDQQESYVGITEYISPGVNILAVSKYLLTDFVVNQITLNGNLVILNNAQMKVFTNQSQNKNQGNQYELSKESYLIIQQKLGQKAALQIEKLYEKMECGDKVSTWQFIIPSIKDKQKRMHIHDFVREKLINIQSNTLEQGNIRLKWKKNLKKISPAARKKYIHFKLYKSNIDTMGALYRLSKITGISQKIFSTAGLKDKRGVTVQMVSVFNTDINCLKRFYKQASKNKQLWIDDFEEMKDSAISIGDLQGNQFGLILRLLYSEQAQFLEDRIQRLKTIGFINYFGLQRFGSCRTKTHMLGVKVIQKNWKELIEQILLESTNSQHVDNIKKELYEQKNYNKAQKQLSNKYKIQKLLFKGLSKYGENYQNVFDSLPRSIKTLYVHSLQSYIWNKIVSKRIKLFGLKLVIGDIVCKENKDKKKMEEEEERTINFQQQDQLDFHDEVADEGAQNIDGVVEDVEDICIDIVTQDNINYYTIHDLVAPLYGPNSTIPQNTLLYSYIESQLADLNLSQQDFTLNSKMLCFNGRFRKIFVKPIKVEHQLLSHAEKKQQLQSPLYTNGQSVTFNEGHLKSLQIILQLPKSCYATMVIRQILHLPSTFELQMKLNKEYDQLQILKSE